ncbi:MAG: hypothetical protein HZB99_04775 [Candidatus Harrisonbacteria bacterium]|nr:hypothetical protein [Candidatus Harrisonbacteria bacterium]
MQPNYYTVEQMLEMVDEPNHSACFRILADNRKLFQTVQGSSNNHQAWPGGYFDHVQEIMNIALVLYQQLNSLRQLPFSLSDALLVVFLHDIEKPWKYEISPDGKFQYIEALKTKQAQHEFRNRKLREYGIALTSDQENGMKYVEGESNDYTNKRRVMGPLAALCHLADVTSARIWFDHPMVGSDPWTGARRNRS